MPYEIYLMRSVLPDILGRVPETDRYFVKAFEIMRKLEGIAEISPELGPESSLLREFIG